MSYSKKRKRLGGLIEGRVYPPVRRTGRAAEIQLKSIIKMYNSQLGPNDQRYFEQELDDMEKAVQDYGDSASPLLHQLADKIKARTRQRQRERAELAPQMVIPEARQSRTPLQELQTRSPIGLRPRKQLKANGLMAFSPLTMLAKAIFGGGVDSEQMAKEQVQNKLQTNDWEEGEGEEALNTPEGQGLLDILLAPTKILGMLSGRGLGDLDGYNPDINPGPFARPLNGYGVNLGPPPINGTLDTSDYDYNYLDILKHYQ